MQASLKGEDAAYHKLMQRQKGESRLFKVGFYTFSNLSSFLVNELWLHFLMCCKNHPPNRFPFRERACSQNLARADSLRFDGAKKQDFALRGQEGWEMISEKYRFDKAISSSQEADRNRVLCSHPQGSIKSETWDFMKVKRKTIIWCILLSVRLWLEDLRDSQINTAYIQVQVLHSSEESPEWNKPMKLLKPKPKWDCHFFSPLFWALTERKGGGFFCGEFCDLRQHRNKISKFPFYPKSSKRGYFFSEAPKAFLKFQRK